MGSFGLTEYEPLKRVPQSHTTATAGRFSSRRNCSDIRGYPGTASASSCSDGCSEHGDSDDEGAPSDASFHTDTCDRYRALRMPAMRLRYVSRSICPDQYVIAISEYIVEAVAPCRSASLRLPVWR